ncbi:hypothetical protein ACFLZX_02880, partial [Nanoarchaeota archaeon]
MVSLTNQEITGRKPTEFDRDNYVYLRDESKTRESQNRNSPSKVDRGLEFLVSRGKVAAVSEVGNSYDRGKGYMNRVVNHLNFKGMKRKKLGDLVSQLSALESKLRKQRERFDPSNLGADATYNRLLRLKDHFDRGLNTIEEGVLALSKDPTEYKQLGDQLLNIDRNLIDMQRKKCGNYSWSVSEERSYSKLKGRRADVVAQMKLLEAVDTRLHYADQAENVEKSLCAIEARRDRLHLALDDGLVATQYLLRRANLELKKKSEVLAIVKEGYDDVKSKFAEWYHGAKDKVKSGAENVYDTLNRPIPAPSLVRVIGFGALVFSLLAISPCTVSDATPAVHQNYQRMT